MFQKHLWIKYMFMCVSQKKTEPVRKQQSFSAAKNKAPLVLSYGTTHFLPLKRFVLIRYGRGQHTLAVQQEYNRSMCTFLLFCNVCPKTNSYMNSIQDLEILCNRGIPITEKLTCKFTQQGFI